MPETKPTAAEQTQTILDAVKAMKDDLASTKAEIAELKKPVYKSGHPAQIFNIARGGTVGKQSEAYSFMRAVCWAQKWLDPARCALEVDTHEKLRKYLVQRGFQPYHPAGSILVPYSVRHLPPPETDEEEKLVTETKDRVKAMQGQYDPDEAEWVNRQLGGHYQKALGTISDAAGGVLVGFPTLGELVDLQRNMEVFARAGATETTLPPNGRIQFPKLTNGATAYWVGEAAQITDSTQATGYLDLVAKKLGLLVKLNNEILRFAGPTTEGMVRMDMARVAALKADLAMLEGTGGTQIKGLTTYDSASSWTAGTDKLIAYTVTSNTFQPNDPADMEALLPDMVGEPTAWVMRRNLWAKIRNRRAAAVTTGDGAGPFVFNITREARENIPLELEGTPVVRSSQVSNTRGSGSQTYVLLGYFPDWVIGRFGVLEFLASGLGDTPLQNDQTWLRGIQHIDAGARHASSFVFADSITIQ